MIEPILTIREVAPRLGVSYQTVWRLVAVGALRASRVGHKRGQWRIPESAIHEYLDRQTNRPAEPAPVVESTRRREPVIDPTFH